MSHDRTQPPRPIPAGWDAIDTAPRDGKPVLVFHDHESDPYFESDDHGSRLTAYGAWCEGNGHETQHGAYIASFGHGFDEDISGEGWGPFAHMPDWWFKHDDPDHEHPLAPTCWHPEATRIIRAATP